MSKLKFYIFLNIFNILLLIFLLGMFINIILMFEGTTNMRLYLGLTVYFTCITLKLRLPKMLVDYADKYKNSLIGNFIQFLHNNPQKEKEIIAIAFCYD